MSFDVDGARRAGYSDKDIAEYLAPRRNFNIVGAREAGYSDADIVSYLMSRPAPAGRETVAPTQVTEAPAQRAPTPERGFFGGIASLAGDTGASIVTGAGSTLSGIGGLGGIAGLGYDNMLSRAGRRVSEFGEGLMSPELVEKRQALSRAIQDAESQGLVGEARAALSTLASNPSLLFSMAIEQIPAFVLSGGVGRGASAIGQVAARRAAVGGGEAAEQAILQAGQRAGQVAAVGTAAGLQGGSVAEETYQDVMRLPGETLQRSPVYQELLRTMSPDEARATIADRAAREAGLLGGGISAGTMALMPSSAERALFSRGVSQSAIRRALGVGTAEAGSEAIEEGGGQFAQNLAIQRRADEERSLTQGVGGAAATGAVLGGIIGGGVGAIQRPPIPPSTEPGAGNLPSDLRGAIADYVANREPETPDITDRLRLVTENLPITAEQFLGSTPEAQERLVARAQRELDRQQGGENLSVLDPQGNRDRETASVRAAQSASRPSDEVIYGQAGSRAEAFQFEKGRGERTEDGATQAELFRQRAEAMAREARPTLGVAADESALREARRTQFVDPGTSAERTVAAARGERPTEQPLSAFFPLVEGYIAQHVQQYGSSAPVSVPAFQSYVRKSTGQLMPLAQARDILSTYNDPAPATAREDAGTQEDVYPAINLRARAKPVPRAAPFSSPAQGEGFVLQRDTVEQTGTTGEPSGVPGERMPPKVTFGPGAQRQDVYRAVAPKGPNTDEAGRPVSPPEPAPSIPTDEYGFARPQQGAGGQTPQASARAAGAEQAAPQAEVEPSEAEGRLSRRVEAQDKINALYLDKLKGMGVQGRLIRNALVDALKNREMSAEQVYAAFTAADTLATLLPAGANHRIQFVKELLPTKELADAIARSGGDPTKELQGLRERPSDSALQGVITISLSPASNVMPYLTETAAHEAFHVLQDYYGKYDPQFAKLMNQSFRDNMMIGDVDPTIRRKLEQARYPNSSKSYWQVLSESLPNVIEDAKEAQAYVFAALMDASRRGVPMTGLKPAFARFVNVIKNFFSKLGSKLRGDGFQTVEEVLGRSVTQGGRRFDQMATPTEQDFPSRGAQASARNLAEMPGVDVSEGNKLGFEPALRVRADVDESTLPRLALISQSTDNKNAARQLAALDDTLSKFPTPENSAEDWAKMEAYAFSSPEVPIPPYNFMRDINGGAVDLLRTLTKGQIEDADHGFRNARMFRQAYINKELSPVTTGKLFMWSFLSRGVSPYTQESLFVDAFDGADQWIRKAAAGDFTEADFPAYERWAKSVAPKGSGQPGAGATHNLNAFGKSFLFKMSRRDAPGGISRLQYLHNLMEDPTSTGKGIRREFVKMASDGVGIDNKVVSFTLLVSGFPDVMVLDRVQMRRLWDDGRFSNKNLYDGETEERVVNGEKKRATKTGTSLAELTYGARGLLIYEAIERALERRIASIYGAVGRPQDASVGRYHWETWVADSQQEASHGSIDAILSDARGDDRAIARVVAKQGEYGGYEYGARYGRDEQGVPYFIYDAGTGRDMKFSVPAFRGFLTDVKIPANGVVPASVGEKPMLDADGNAVLYKVGPNKGQPRTEPIPFSVSESGNAPWYTRPEVNRERLRELASSWADRGGGTGERARTVFADAARAEASALDRAGSGSAAELANEQTEELIDQGVAALQSAARNVQASARGDVITDVEVIEASGTRAKANYVLVADLKSGGYLNINLSVDDGVLKVNSLQGLNIQKNPFKYKTEGFGVYSEGVNLTYTGMKNLSRRVLEILRRNHPNINEAQGIRVAGARMKAARERGDESNLESLKAGAKLRALQASARSPLAADPAFAALRDKLTGKEYDKPGVFSNALRRFTGALPGEKNSSALVRTMVNRAAPGWMLDRLAKEKGLSMKSVGLALEVALNNSGRVQMYLDHGPLGYDPKTGDVKVREDVPGLVAAIKGRLKIADKREAQSYLVALRERDLRKSGKKGFFNLTDAEINQIISKSEAAHPEWKQMAADIQRINKALLDFAVATGTLDRSKADQLGSMFYTPFYRQADEDAKQNANEVVGPRLSDSLTRVKTAFDLSHKGGENPLGDLFENMIRNADVIMKAGMKNVAMRQAAEVMEAVGLGRPSKDRVSGKTITYRVDGQDKNFEVDDPVLYTALAGAPRHVTNGIYQTMANFAGFFRDMITLAPSFMLSNLWRGKIMAYVQEGVPFYTNTFDGLQQALKSSASYKAIAAQTGFGGYTYGMGERDAAAAFELEIGGLGYGPKGLWYRFTQPLQKASEATEMAERIKLYERAKAQGMTDKEAAFQAYLLAPFSRRGMGGGWAGDSVNFFVPLVPFLNAKIQGMYRLIENEKGDTQKLWTLGIPKQMLLRGLVVMAASLALAAKNMADEPDRWDEENPDIKFRYDIIYLPNDKRILLPRAFEVGSVFGALPVFLLDARRREDGRDLQKALTDLGMSTFFFNPIPAAAVPLIGAATNYDFFRARALETAGDRSKLPEERVNRSTSAVAKFIGEQAGVSPIRVQYVLEGYSGTIGSTVLAGFDSILASMDLIPTKPAGAFGDPMSMPAIIAGLTGANRFYRSDDQTASRFVGEFYKIKEMTDQLVRSQNMAMETRDLDRLAELRGDAGLPLRLRPMVNQASTQIAEIGKRMARIERSDMDSVSKADALRPLREQRDMVARRVVERARQIGAY